MLIALIPLALLIYFASQIYIEKSSKIDVLDNYFQRTESATLISMAVDEIQTERRYTYGYIIKNDWRAELVIQRPKTDSSLQRLKRNPLLKGIETYSLFDSLSSYRAGIDRNTVSPEQAMNYFTNIIFRLNSLNSVSAGNVILAPVMQDLNGQKLLSEMITYLGRIRAYIFYDLYAGRDGSIAAENSKSVYDIYKSYEKEFLLKASPIATQEYRKLTTGSNLNVTENYIQHLLQTGRTDNNLDAEKWWQVSANAIDGLKELQRNLLGKAQSGLTNIIVLEKKSRDRALLFLILSIALVLGIMVYTIAIISKVLNEVNVAAQKISLGITGISLKPESNDVIGSLVQSILRIDQNNKTLAEAADAIGSGRFDVEVQPRSGDDILGNAVVRMRNDLQQFNIENEEKLWIHSGVEAINDSIRGEKEVVQLSNDALHALVTYIQAEMGLLYVGYDGFLKYSAGYAIADVASVPNQLKFGETLVGQAAQKKQVMHLKNVPPDFIKIKTASGEAVPRNLLMIPFVHNNKVEGIAEIGSLEEFNPKVLLFIQQVAPAIAIALEAAKSRARLQELFEETQSQAEELQAQHGELENINAELEAQTAKLQASEEELKVQQEELLQANQELEERSRLLEERNQVIVERNLEIQQKAEELALSTKYKSEFLANMSHELRTPLNSVLLLSRLLSENNEKNLTSDQVEYAQVIQSSGQGLLSLIDEILDLSKIESGKMDLEYSTVFLQEIADDMKTLFQPVAQDRKLEFEISIDKGLPSQIDTDKMRLEQVLKNLLSNALKFTSQGSVKLNIHHLPDNPTFLAFTVTDTGIGIPAEKQALIFEAFQQADGSTRRKFGGTGLGLSISRELTRLLGGEIKVSSEPGKGSEFTLYIPVNRIVAAQKPMVSRTEIDIEIPETEQTQKVYRLDKIPENLPDDRTEVKQNDKTILIIEDDTAFAKALLDFTHKKGYKGLVAVRGDEGVALAQQYKPVGILLDIQLPVKDGWEVMEELKSNPATRHIPVHIMSSLEAKKESLMKGAVDFINKPVAFEQMQEVFKKIEQVISKEHKKVLIVEENPKHAKALAYFLETFDVNAQISNTVNGGMNALKKDDVDCVILDMGIPDQQAYETLENVKKNPGFETLPIIIFTGKSLSKTEESRIRQYADSIVIKTAHSYQRILDEVSLFLHLMEEGKQAEKPVLKYRRLGALNEVLSGKKILVTDDDVRNIFSLTKALEIHNMQVFTAVDGKEALKQLEEHPDISVVLMDIMMPEMDGYEAMQAIRKKKQFKNLPIIAVTAKAMTGDREKCIKAGASDYISKPVDVDQLLSLLRVWLYDKSIV